MSDLLVSFLVLALQPYPALICLNKILKRVMYHKCLRCTLLVIYIYVHIYCYSHTETDLCTHTRIHR